MTTDSMALPKPGHMAIRIGVDGRPSIEAYRCEDCGAVFADRPLACRACASRQRPHSFVANQDGSRHSWSVVHRSYPGISVPFVSAIVDLSDGLTLKGTLREVADKDLRQGLPVQLVFDDAGGATDKDGLPYVGFHFTAKEGA